jgi:hypothetical protein
MDSMTSEVMVLEHGAGDLEGRRYDMSRSMKRALYTPIFVAFMGVSTWATLDAGYLGIFAAGLRDPASMQILFDVVVACILGSSWLHRHATERGRNPWPWLVAVPVLGSIPLMAYAVGSLWLPSAAPVAVKVRG